jgi:alkanesulfonate monooxygenase SsuD/methylene tetrahydromethanopterin reductase-like flavin-dependent oxidoreductase (luciferase family)
VVTGFGQWRKRPVKFSMIFEAQMTDTSRTNERQVIRDCVEQAVLAEAVGFDAVWAVEHHALKWYAHMSAPEIFLTYVAAKTSRIRIGHGVVCMPFGFNPPMRVAERVAMLDILSDGRLDVGAGRGATKQEMSLFGVQPDDTYPQVEETLRILGHCWRDELFEWHSGGVDFDPHPILPRPVQEPHPPLFLACTKNETVALAAELGIGALVLGFAGPDEVASLRKMYDEAIGTRSGDRFVSDHANNHFSALCPTIVLDDPAEALRVGARGQRFFAEAITHWYGGGPEPEVDTADEDNVAAIQRSGEKLIARLHEANIPYSPNTTSIFNPDHAYGTSATAIDYVTRLIDGGADEIMCLMQMGTVPHAACMETIRQWGQHVIPHFRARS